MRNSQTRSRYEAQLATANRALYRALEVADELHDDGASEDLAELLRHTAVLMHDSLKGKHKPKLVGHNQLQL